MHSKTVNILQKSSLWLALLLHVLLFFSLSYVWVYQYKSEEKPPEYIPSYAYHEEKSASVQQNKTIFQKTPKKNIPTSKDGVEKPVFNPREIRFNQVVDISSAKDSEPVHLIGDNKKTPKPLIILLGKAMTAKLAYPRAAIDLTIKGVAVIGFVLHPDGQVTDVRLLKSSSADILDQAALSAAYQISPVKNVGSYITQPEAIVFGIIFGGRQ